MNPDKLHPIDGIRNTVFLKPLIEASGVVNVSAGEYSYYSSFDDPEKFLTDSVLYNFGFSGTALRIGKYCAIAHGVKFIMADANHATEGVTTFPFAIFGGKWADRVPITEYPYQKFGDIVIGHDVWLGMRATVMPGVSIGHGAIIGAQAVVAGDIPPYSIAVGNPARVIRSRYEPGDIERLLELGWWDWDAELIDAALPILVGGQVGDLLEFAQAHNVS